MLVSAFLLFFALQVDVSQSTVLFSASIWSHLCLCSLQLLARGGRWLDLLWLAGRMKKNQKSNAELRAMMSTIRAF